MQEEPAPGGHALSQEEPYGGSRASPALLHLQGSCDRGTLLQQRECLRALREAAQQEEDEEQEEPGVWGLP